MKREMDLIRDILLEIQASTGKVEMSIPDEPGMEDQWAKLHQVKLLIKGGYLEGVAHCDPQGRCFAATVMDLTWQGHDLVDNIATETVWAKTKEALKDFGGSVSADLLKTVSTTVAAKLLGL